MFPLAFIFTPLLVFSLFLRVCAAAATVTTSATCDPAWDVLNNKENQNPCLVAAYLLSVCNDGSWFLPALPLDNLHRFYVPPTTDGTVLCANCTRLSTTVVNTLTDCACSPVTYYMVQACSFCQPVGFSTDFGIYMANCAALESPVGIYPHAIPTDTSVPAYAYLNPDNTQDSFNQTIASQIEASHIPDSTGSPSSTAGSSSSPAPTNQIQGPVTPAAPTGAPGPPSQPDPNNSSGVRKIIFVGGSTVLFVAFGAILVL